MPSIPGTINFPTALDDAISLVEVNNNASSTLNAAIDADDLLIPVTDPNEFSASGFATLLDNPQAPTKIEIVIFTSKSGNNLVIPPGGRGAQGTVAQAFAPGQFIEQRPTARDHTVLADAIIAIENLLPVGAANRLAFYPALGRAIDDAPGLEHLPGSNICLFIKPQADDQRGLLIEPFSDSYSLVPLRVRNVADDVRINFDPAVNISDVFFITSDRPLGAGMAVYNTDPGANSYFGFGSDSAFGNLAVHGSGASGSFLTDIPSSMSISQFNANGGLFLAAIGPIVFSTGGTFGDDFEDERMRLRATGITQYAPSSALGDGVLRTNEVHIFLDESGNKLKFKVKYAGGTVKTGEIALA